MSPACRVFSLHTLSPVSSLAHPHPPCYYAEHFKVCGGKKQEESAQKARLMRLIVRASLNLIA